MTEAGDRAPHIEPHPAMALPLPHGDDMTDTCRPVTVTGEDGESITVSVLGAEPMTDEAAHHFEAIVQAAQRRHASENPETR